jgi:hypothetical protein
MEGPPVIVPHSTTSYSFATAMTLPGSYVVTVTARGTGDASSNSNPSPTSSAQHGLLAAPVVTATKTNTAVSLSWGSIAGATGYNIYQGSTKLNTSSITDITYIDQALTPAQSYSYHVKAVNVNGEGLSGDITVITNPSPVTSLYDKSPNRSD